MAARLGRAARAALLCLMAQSVEGAARITPPTPYDDVPGWAVRYDARAYPGASLTVDVLGFAPDVATRDLRVIAIERSREPFAGLDAWPGGFVDLHEDSDTLAAAYRELREETGQREVGLVQELRTYARMGRDPREFAGFWDAERGQWVQRGTRVASIAHVGLMPNADRTLEPNPDEDARRAFWTTPYRYLPWEDQRTDAGRESVRRAVGALCGTVRDVPAIHRIFGLEGHPWNEELVAERYALLAEAGLVEEALRDRWGRVGDADRETFGVPMAFDHRVMLADALSRIRGQVKYQPLVIAALMPTTFTLDEFQATLEGVLGRALHRPNFRRLVTSARQGIQLVTPTGEVRAQPGRGSDPQLFRISLDARSTPRLPSALRMPLQLDAGFPD
jgi:hypothetical protein